VTVIVGSEAEKRECYIHAGLLTHYSSYFRNALKPEWVEGRTKNIVVSEDSPSMFQIFFLWLYSGKLYSTLANGRVPISTRMICTLYIFGDANGIPELCDAAVDLVFQKFANEWAFPAQCLSYIYDHTLASSKLREIFIHLAVYCFSFCNLRSEEECFPKEFLIDVILRSRQSKTWPGNFQDKETFLDKTASEMCIYHAHNKNMSIKTQSF
jgi:hypothetical protein